jgi:hypothetical protein
MTVLKPQDDDAQIRLQADLDGVADRLHAEFDEALGADTVTRRLADVVSSRADARILTYLPVLIESEARRALQLLRSAMS